MAPFNQLSDNFADNSIARAWTAFVGGSGAVSEASGRATCTLPSSTAGSHTAYYRSTHQYDLTGDAAAININGMVATGVAATMTFEVYRDAANVYRWRQLSGTLTARKVVGGVDTQLFTVAWSAVTHKWVRIRESGGNVLFDTSPDGVTWTNRATQSVAGAFPVTALTVQFGASCGNVASPGALTVEDFNPLSLSTTWRWTEGEREYSHRIGSASIAATGGVGYLAIAQSIDSAGNLVSPVYYSGPLADGRELTLQATQADAQNMAPRLPTNGRWHVPPSAFVEGRYVRLFHRSHDGASYTLREFYPRRFIQADDIEAESIRALHIAAGSITADKLSVLTLDAITGNMGTLTAGTITGATVQTATSGARIELTSANGLRSYNSGGTLQIQLRTSDGALAWGGGANLLDAAGARLEVGGAAGSAPAIRWMSGGTELHRIHGDSSGLWMLSQNTRLGISPSDYGYVSTDLVVGSDRVAGGALKGTLDVFGNAYVEGGSVYAAETALGGALPPAGVVAAEAGLRAPRSSGSAVFALDGATMGSAIVLANLATATPFGGSAVFGGLFFIHETAVDGAGAVFFTAGGGIVKIADPGGLYTTTSGNAGTVNVYLSAQVVTIENRRGGSRTFNVVGLRGRNAN